MEIRILQLVAGAKEASGLTVVIDVFRAFTTACFVSANGAERIVPLANLEQAYRLKKANPDWVLMGERHGAAPPGFDFGNSPAQIEHIDFTGKTVLHTTSAGTQGIANAVHADEIITGAFVNAAAVVAYIRQKNPPAVSLVCMGEEAREPSDEDTLCAEFIRSSLLGQPPAFEPIRQHLRSYHTGAKFFDPSKSWAPERDFDLCLSLNRFDFVLRAAPFSKGLSCLTRTDSSSRVADTG
jgi:2-phosphosulfolactate phosphatase